MKVYVLFTYQSIESSADQQVAFLHSGTKLAPSGCSMSLRVFLLSASSQEKSTEKVHLLFKRCSLEVAHMTSTIITLVSSRGIWKLLI